MPVVLVVILVLAMFASDAVARVKREAQITRAEEWSEMAYWTAESGFNVARASLIQISKGEDWGKWKANYGTKTTGRIEVPNDKTGVSDVWEWSYTAYAPGTTGLPSLPEGYDAEYTSFIVAEGKYVGPGIRGPLTPTRRVTGFVMNRTVMAGSPVACTNFTG